MVEIGAVAVQRLGQAHDPRGPGLPGLPAARNVRAGDHVGQDHMQCGIGLRFELAVFHDMGQFAIGLLAQRVVARFGQRAGMRLGQCLRHGLAQIPHGLAQRLIGGPFLAMVQRQRRRRFVLVSMSVRFRSLQRACRQCQRQGKPQGEQEAGSVGFHDAAPERVSMSFRHLL